MIEITVITYTLSGLEVNLYSKKRNSVSKQSNVRTGGVSKSGECPKTRLRRERGESLGIGEGGKHTISRILKEELVVVDEDGISRQEDEREWVGNKVEEKRRERKGRKTRS